MYGFCNKWIILYNFWNFLWNFNFWWKISKTDSIKLMHSKKLLTFPHKKKFVNTKKNWINFYFMSPDLCHSYLTKIKFNPFQFTCNFFFFKFLLWKTRNILITKNKIVYWIKEYIYFFASWENVRHLQNQKKKLYIEAKTIYS